METNVLLPIHAFSRFKDGALQKRVSMAQFRRQQPGDKRCDYSALVPRNTLIINAIAVSDVVVVAVGERVFLFGIHLQERSPQRHHDAKPGDALEY